MYLSAEEVSRALKAARLFSCLPAQKFVSKLPVSSLRNNCKPQVQIERSRDDVTRSMHELKSLFISNVTARRGKKAST